MQSKTNTQVATKKVSHRASITGGVLSIIALASGAIGSGLVHANLHTPATTTAQKIDAAVADTTISVFAKLISVPFLVAAICLAGLAIIFTIIRLKKVKAGGLLLSVVWIALSGWALQLSIAAFQILKAH